MTLSKAQDVMNLSLYSNVFPLLLVSVPALNVKQCSVKHKRMMCRGDIFKACTKCKHDIQLP